MKKLATKIVMGAMFGWPMSALATEATPTPAKTPVTNAASTATPAKVTPATSEKTEHSFEDLLVQGKYHFSDEAVTTVEEDKVLDSLLGIRADFKDKIEQSAGRY